MKILRLRIWRFRKAISGKIVEDRRQRLIKFLLLSSLLLLAGCSQLAYNVNLYQDGKVLGKGQVEVCGAIGLGRLFDTSISTYTYCKNLRCTTTKKEETNQSTMLLANGSLRYGLSRKIDVGGDAFLSHCGEGAPIYFKFGLTDSLSKWGLALMPVAGYGRGTDYTSEETVIWDWEEGYEKEKLSSSAWAIELAIPISYHSSPDFAIQFGPRIYN